MSLLAPVFGTCIQSVVPQVLSTRVDDTDLARYEQKLDLETSKVLRQALRRL
jgi:hypothetical protein